LRTIIYESWLWLLSPNFLCSTNILGSYYFPAASYMMRPKEKYLFHYIFVFTCLPWRSHNTRNLQLHIHYIFRFPRLVLTSHVFTVQEYIYFLNTCFMDMLLPQHLPHTNIDRISQLLSQVYYKILSLYFLFQQ
jgi:hypothetical protein